MKRLARVLVILRNSTCNDDFLFLTMPVEIEFRQREKRRIVVEDKNTLLDLHRSIQLLLDGKELHMVAEMMMSTHLRPRDKVSKRISENE